MSLKEATEQNMHGGLLNSYYNEKSIQKRE